MAKAVRSTALARQEQYETVATKRSQGRSGGNTGRRRSASQGRRGGWARGLLWLIVIGLLAVIARYAYIAAQPDRRCYTFLQNKTGCDRAEDYSDSDRAKLESVVEKAIPAQYVKRRMP